MLVNIWIFVTQRGESRRELHRNAAFKECWSLRGGCRFPYRRGCRHLWYSQGRGEVRLRSAQYSGLASDVGGPVKKDQMAQGDGDRSVQEDSDGRVQEKRLSGAEGGLGQNSLLSPKQHLGNEWLSGSSGEKKQRMLRSADFERSAAGRPRVLASILGWCLNSLQRWENLVGPRIERWLHIGG